MKKSNLYGKKVANFRGWSIYKQGCEETAVTYDLYLPEQSPHYMDYPEWSTDSLEEAKEFIRDYNKEVK